MRAELREQIESDKRRLIANGTIKRDFDAFDNFLMRIGNKSLEEGRKFLCMIYSGNGSSVTTHNIGREIRNVYKFFKTFYGTDKISYRW